MCGPERLGKGLQSLSAIRGSFESLCADAKYCLAENQPAWKALLFVCVGLWRHRGGEFLFGRCSMPFVHQGYYKSDYPWTSSWRGIFQVAFIGWNRAGNVISNSSSDHELINNSEGKGMTLIYLLWFVSSASTLVIFQRFQLQADELLPPLRQPVLKRHS